MRILVGVLGALLRLPWVVAFGVFAEAYPPQQRRAVAALGLVFGMCFVAAVGSLVTPAWHRAGVVALAAVSVFYAVAVVGRLVGRLRGRPSRRR